MVEQQFAPQDAEYRLSDKGAVLLSQCQPVAEITAEHGVRRIFKRQHTAECGGCFLEARMRGTRTRVDHRFFGFGE